MYEEAGDSHCLDVLNVGINQMPEKGRKDTTYTRDGKLACEWTMLSCVLHTKYRGPCANVEVGWGWGADPPFYPNAAMKEPERLLAVLLKIKK